MFSLTRINCSPKYLKDYFPLVPQIVEKIFHLAKSLQGLRIVHVNATAVGGGVAEILRSLVPLQCDIGLKSSWYVIPPDERFFEVTKEIHNFLQGKAGHLTNQQKKVYLDYSERLGGLLTSIKTDILLIHDPQPAAALTFINGHRPPISIWRCHIDTSRPNKKVWNFLLPYLKIYDHFVFTMAGYTNQAFPKNKVSFITPVIDPFAVKNKIISKTDSQGYVAQFGISTTRPLVTQISRLDPWKDPQGVVDAFLLAKKQIPALQLALVAQMASDDPEGVRIYQQVKDYIKGKKDIFLLVNLPDNETAVNAFQTASQVILQKSIREGFGMTVTEAMWKGAVVVGGNVGGIKLQIKDGVNGFLINSPQEAAEKIVYILKNPKVTKRVSVNAHKSVKNNFLMPHKLLNYLNLFHEILAPHMVSKHHYLTPQFLGLDPV